MKKGIIAWIGALLLICASGAVMRAISWPWRVDLDVALDAMSFKQCVWLDQYGHIAFAIAAAICAIGIIWYIVSSVLVVHKIVSEEEEL